MHNLPNAQSCAKCASTSLALAHIALAQALQEHQRAQEQLSRTLESLETLVGEIPFGTCGVEAAALREAEIRLAGARERVEECIGQDEQARRIVVEADKEARIIRGWNFGREVMSRGERIEGECWLRFRYFTSSTVMLTETLLFCAAELEARDRERAEELARDEKKRRQARQERTERKSQRKQQWRLLG